MIPIYICEDEPQQLKILKKIVSESIHSNGYSGIKVKSATNDPLIILEKVNVDEISLYFLDIDLGTNKMSGLDLAKEIRKHNINAYIVMITAYNFALETYQFKIGVKDYIIKSNPDTMSIKIKECLKDFYNSVQTIEADKCSYLKISNSYKISIDEIYYISVKPDEKRKVLIYRKNGYSTLPISLKELISQNNVSLFLCDRSHMININYIKKIDRNNKCIFLDNGIKISVSRRRIRILERMI